MLGWVFDRCQVLALRSGNTEPTGSLLELLELSEVAQLAFATAAHANACAVLLRLLCRTAVYAGVVQEPEIAVRIAKTAMLTGSGERWHPEFAALVSCCIASMKQKEMALPGHDQREDIVKRVRALLDSRYHDPTLTLADAARAADRSAAYTSTILTTQTGRSFTEHLRYRRVVAAKDLLRRTSLTMKEIAIAVGFNDGSRFSRAFRRTECISPSAYRRSWRR